MSDGLAPEELDRTTTSPPGGIVGEGTDPRDVLPKHCPLWCISGPDGHLQAFYEIGDPDPAWASKHGSGDRGGRLDTLIQPHTNDVLREGGHRWSVELKADGTDHFHGYPFVVFEVSDKERDNELCLQLTSGDARILASQLTYLAGIWRPPTKP